VSESAQTLFIGVGNAWRRDDGVGPWIAARLAREGADAIEHGGDGADLVNFFGSRRRVILFDAVERGAEPGRIIRIDPRKDAIEGIGFRHSSHQFGVAEAVGTATALDLLPQELVIYGIEGADFSQGLGLSGAVLQAAVAMLSCVGALR